MSSKLFLGCKYRVVALRGGFKVVVDKGENWGKEVVVVKNSARGLHFMLCSE
jgi:hypothetical protein